jgi:hypothetical protein
LCLPRVIGFGAVALAEGGGQVGLRGLQVVALSLGFERPDSLPRRHGVADTDQPLKHPPAGAEGKRRNLRRLDRARRRHDVGSRRALGDDHTHGAHGLGGRFSRFLAGG